MIKSGNDRTSRIRYNKTLGILLTAFRCGFKVLAIDLLNIRLTNKKIYYLKQQINNNAVYLSAEKNKKLFIEFEHQKRKQGKPTNIKMPKSKIN